MVSREKITYPKNNTLRGCKHGHSFHNSMLECVCTVIRGHNCYYTRRYMYPGISTMRHNACIHTCTTMWSVVRKTRPDLTTINKFITLTSCLQHASGRTGMTREAWLARLTGPPPPPSPTRCVDMSGDGRDHELRTSHKTHPGHTSELVKIDPAWREGGRERERERVCLCETGDKYITTYDPI